MKIKERSFLATALVGLALVGCARAPETDAVDQAMFLAAGQQHLSGSALAIPETQTELQTAMGEINHALFTALVPEYASDTTQTSSAVCKPDFKLQFIGAAIEFSPTNGCKLSGTIGIKFFPTRVAADIDVIGMSHVEKIQFDADVTISNGVQVKLDMTVLNGVISLRSFNISAIESVTANGRVALAIGGGAFKIDSRINAFVTSTGMGVTLMSKIDRSIGVSSVAACLLSGGVGSNPNAGTATPCMRLGGG